MSSIAVAVLSGQIQQDEKGWHTEEHDGPGDKIGPTYARFRVAATACMARRFPDAVIIASGFAFFPEGPSIASVVRSELVELGVPAERIRTQDTPASTYQELALLAKLPAEGVTDIFIITNEWHAARVQVMAEHFPELSKAQVVSAEEVLLAQDPDKWQSRIARMRADPRIAERIALEKQGIEALRAGTYRF